MLGRMKLGEVSEGKSFCRERTKERPEIPAPTMRIFLPEMKGGGGVGRDILRVTGGDGWSRGLEEVGTIIERDCLVMCEEAT